MLRGTRGGQYSSSPIEETPFGMLSDAEEREMERARHRRERDGSDDEDHRQYRHDEHHSDAESSHTYDSRRRRSPTERSSGDGLRRLSSYPTTDGIRSVFDFTAMEEFAATERQALDETEGPVTGATAEELASASGIEAEMRRRSEAVVRVASPARRQSGENESGSGSSTRQDATEDPKAFEIEPEVYALPKAEDEEQSPPHQRFGRRRARKQAQANPARRQAKLALFESFGGGDGDDIQGGALKAPRPGARPHAPPPAEPAPKFVPYSDTPGHDRPYRFSFYSNALPVTIHARSLAELPAEGQTFEDLFKGRNIPGEDGAQGVPAAVPSRTSGDYGTSPRGGSGRNTPKEPGLLSLSAPKPQSVAQVMAKSVTMPGAAPTPPPPNAEDDPEAYTWWLDVLSPTDDEMRMLSRVFGIHPLTTEDILLEETREKIELFRNYYLVCFRSFDQDPYSQTYLEPLNMYIIVFREGTLSVSTSERAPSFVQVLTPVPLPRHTTPAKCAPAYQASQGLHLCHVRLDLLRAHRRHHRRVWPSDSEHRVRGRQHRRARPDPEGRRADGYAPANRYMPQEGHGPVAPDGQQGGCRQGSGEAV